MTTEPQNESREVKPCPFCGKEGKLSKDEKVVFLVCGCVPDCCDRNDSNVLIDRWNNAWAHKRIAGLEAELKTVYAQDRKNQDVLNEENLKLARQLDKQGKALKKIRQGCKSGANPLGFFEIHKIANEALKSAEELKEDKNWQ